MLRASNGSCIKTIAKSVTGFSVESITNLYRDLSAPFRSMKIRNFFILPLITAMSNELSAVGFSIPCHRSDVILFLSLKMNSFDGFVACNVKRS
jgi:hypothetical protein